MSQLRNEFFAETGVEWENGQGEPDIDYVTWLEAKVENGSLHSKPSPKCLCGREATVHYCYRCFNNRSAIVGGAKR